MDLEALFAEPTHRRWWLLTKALECTSLDQAIDLARAADRFVLGENCEEQAFAAATTPSHGIAAETAEAHTVDLNHQNPSTMIKSSRMNLSDGERKPSGAGQVLGEDKIDDKPTPPASNGHPLFWQTAMAEQL